MNVVLEKNEEEMNVKSLDLKEQELKVGTVNIRVFGTGGSGNNMVSWLYKKGIRGAEVLACNTDSQHLKLVEADKKFLLGRGITRGLGCGGDPAKGAEAAQESLTELKEYVKNSDMVFVCAGMGGGTGTGSAPVIAKVAKETGAIVVGVVTMPFSIERARVDKAEWGLQELRKNVDTAIIIDNNRLVQIAGNLPLQQAFSVANELIASMIKGIVETISTPSLVNLDFADVRAIMKGGGVASIGVGSSDTKNRAEEAVRSALENPLLEVDYEGATGALIHVSGGPDMTLDEINTVGELITEKLDRDANVIWGARVSDDLKGKLMVMSIITGVSSPWLLGEVKQKEAEKISEELGIELLN